MATLEGFLDELIVVVRQASGIRYAPDDPPSSIATDPAAIVWLADGRCTNAPLGVATYLHGIRIGLLTGMANISTANQKILPKIETVIEAILAKWQPGVTGFSNAQTLGAITYTYGPVEWGGVWYFGAVIDLEEVKIQRELT